MSTSPTPLNAAQRIAGYLASQGFEQVFAVTGGGAMFLNQAFATHPGLRITYLHHEQACAMAAEGYARQTGKPAIVNVTTGPGGLNALNGVFGAYTDSVPMLVISGQVKRATALDHTPVEGLRQLGDQEVRIVPMLAPVTKAAWAVGSVEQLADVLPQAVHLCRSGRPGPTWLDMPIDLQNDRTPWTPATLPEATLAQPSLADLEAVMAALAKAQRPVILAGSGVRLAGAVDELLQVAEAAGIPVATAWTHDLIASDHPLFAGRPGTIGTRAGNLVLQQADCVLVIGSRLNIRQASYNWDSFARHAHRIQVDVDEAELRKPLVQPHHAVVADAKAFLQALARQPLATLPDFQDWRQWVQAVQRQHPALEPSNTSAEGLINPYQFIDQLFTQLPEQASVVCGNASVCIMPFQVGRLKAGQRLMSNSGSASMGWDLPAALGVALADPARRVVCLAGDGSLQMNVQELQSLKTLGLNVAVVVLANDGYLSIRLSHQNFFGTVMGADRASGVECPDYAALARAYGLRALDVAHPQDLPQVWEALNQEGPVVIQVHVDPRQEFSPKLKSRVDENGQFQTPELDDMFPFLPADTLQALRESALRVQSQARQAPSDPS